MESCIIVCTSPQFVRDVLESLKANSTTWPASFVWTCEATIGSAAAVDTVVALGATEMRLFEASQRDGSQSVARHSAASFNLSLEISIDGACIEKHHDREVIIEYGLQQRLTLLFPTPDILERFVQFFSRCADPTQLVVRDGRSSSVTSSNTARSVGDKRPGKADDGISLHSADTDYFHLGSNKAFCAKARHKWQKFTSKVRRKGQEEALFHVGETKSSERGLSNVLLSMDAQLGPNTHEIVVVTDVALFVVKRRDPSIFKVFLPIIGVDSFQMAKANPGGAHSDSVVEWDVMIILDLLIPVSTTSADLRLKMDNRNKNLLLSHLARQYETLRLQRLQTLVLEDTIFWRKRTFFETKLIRVANKVRNGILRATGAVEAAIKMEEDTAQNLREALVDHTEPFVHALCRESIKRSTPEDPDELGFVARFLLSTSRRCGVAREVILAAVSFETSRLLSGAAAATRATSGRSESSGYFRSRTLVDSLLLEHCMHLGEQYLRVQLAQMMEEFVSSSSKHGTISDAECLRYVRELSSVLCDSVHNDSLFPDVLREIMAMIQTVQKLAGENEAWHPADDFIAHMFIGRAVEAPQSHGLVSEELSVSQLQMLKLISTVFQRVVSSHVGASSQRLLADHPLHDMCAADVERIYHSSQFQVLAKSIQPQVHQFLERLVDESSKREVSRMYDRMSRHSMSHGAKVARPPLLDSDVKVLHMMHGLLEKRAASIMNATFGGKDSICLPKVRFQDSVPSPAKSSENVGVSKKVIEENAELRRRLGRLELAMEQAKAQVSTSAASIHQLNREVLLRDEELGRLRRQLRETDAHFFPDPSTFMDENDSASVHPPSMMKESSPTGAQSTSLYAYYCQEVLSSPRRVFACPLDSYTVHDRHQFSPSEGSSLS